MKLQRILTTSVTTMLLASLGVMIHNNHYAHASQPIRAFRQTNGRNNHCYYGFYYLRKDDEPGTHVHYQSGTLPRYLRKRGRYVPIYDPAIKAESPVVKRHHSRYYIDDVDGQHYSHHRYYDEILVNTRDVHGISNRQDRAVLRSFKSQLKRNQRTIKRHRHNRKLVNWLELRDGSLDEMINTDNTNNRQRMDPKHRTRINHRKNRRHVNRHKRQIRRRIPNRKHHKKVVSHKSHKITPKRSVIDSQEIARARNQNLADINADRANVGVDPIQASQVLNQMAELRSQQLVQHFSHKDSNGVNYIQTDLENAGYPDLWNGENIDETYGNNGKEAGNNANYAFWNKEKGVTPDQDGGHRKDIRNPQFQSVGVGATYDANRGLWFFAQDFSDQSPEEIDNSKGSNDDNDSSDQPNVSHLSAADNDRRNAAVEASIAHQNQLIAIQNAKSALSNDESELDYQRHSTFEYPSDKQKAVDHWVNQVSQDETALQQAIANAN